MKRILCSLILLLLLSACGKSVDIIKDAIVIDESAIALLSLVTYDGKNESNYGLMNLGHAFITVENIGDDAIEVYGIEVLPTEEITFSAWNTSLHAGVWFNIESAYIKDFARYEDRYSLTVGLNDLSEIEKLSTFISNNDIWTVKKNCSYFSIKLWNEMVSDNYKLDTSLITRPIVLKKEIMLFEGHQLTKPIVYNDKMGYVKADTFRPYKMEAR